MGPPWAHPVGSYDPLETRQSKGPTATLDFTTRATNARRLRQPERRSVTCGELRQGANREASTPGL